MGCSTCFPALRFSLCASSQRVKRVKHETLLCYHTHLLPKCWCANLTRPAWNPVLKLFPEPHIGHLQTLLIGDIYARYNRLARPWNPVHFLAGTDEHGLKIQQAAAAAGKEPGAFCEELSKRFQVSLSIHITVS